MLIYKSAMCNVILQCYAVLCVWRDWEMVYLLLNISVSPSSLRRTIEKSEISSLQSVKLTDSEGKTPLNTVQQACIADPPLLTIWTEILLSQSQISPSVSLHILKWLRLHHGNWFIQCFSIYPGWTLTAGSSHPSLFLCSPPLAEVA